MIPVYYGHLEAIHKYPDYQGVHVKASFGTITKCVDDAGVLIFKSLRNGFHCVCIHGMK